MTYGVAGRDGQEYSAVMSSLYVRREDGWKLAFHRQTPPLKTPGRIEIRRPRPRASATHGEPGPVCVSRTSWSRFSSARTSRSSTHMSRASRSERRPASPVAAIAAVASFFVPRVDKTVDALLPAGSGAVSARPRATDRARYLTDEGTKRLPHEHAPDRP